QIRENDIVVAQFPVYPKLYRYLLKTLRRKHTNIILFITDIDGLKDGDDLLLKKEIRFLKHFSRFIVHNGNMAGWLLKHVPAANFSTLGPFDFLAPVNQRQPSSDITINFSGNLSKSPFLEKTGDLQPLQFYVYGPGLTENMKNQPNLHWMGILDPKVLPNIILGKFGLIWDGDDFTPEGGSVGRYMSYVNHHKLSLYILSGLPVIAPESSGSAGFISEMNIGWLIRDLHELPAIIPTITEEDYLTKRQNLLKIAENVATGRHLASALENLLNSSVY
ncbi:hypothetical protein, partial [Flavihumibacter petaseus]